MLPKKKEAMPSSQTSENVAEKSRSASERRRRTYNANGSAIEPAHTSRDAAGTDCERPVARASSDR